MMRKTWIGEAALVVAFAALMACGAPSTEDEAPAESSAALTGQYRLTVDLGGNGSGSVTGNGIDCQRAGNQTTGTCSVDLDPGTVVTLTASPNFSTQSAFSDFVGWRVPYCDVYANECSIYSDDPEWFPPSFAYQLTDSYTFTMNGNKVVATGFSSQVLTVKTYGLLTTDSTFAVTGTQTSVPLEWSNGVPPAFTSCRLGATACTANSTKNGVWVLSVTGAQTGYEFKGWSGAGCSGKGTCTVTMGSAKTVTANFGPQLATLANYTLSVNTVNGNAAGVSVTGAGPYPANTLVTLSAPTPPNNGYYFDGWAGCDSVDTTPTDPPSLPRCKVWMLSSRAVTATYRQYLELSVSRVAAAAGITPGTVTVSGGVVSPETCDSSSCPTVYVKPGASVSLAATQSPGNATSVTWDGACGNQTIAGCSFTMTANKAVTATFGPATYRLTVGHLGTGTGTVTGSGLSCTTTTSTEWDEYGDPITVTTTVCTADAPPGGLVTLTATAEQGSTFTGWSGAGCSTGDTCAFTMNSATTVMATFDALPAP